MEGDDKFTLGVLRSAMKPNRNSGLFVKRARPHKDSAKVIAEKARLVAEFLATKGVNRCTPDHSRWMEPDTALWRS